MPIRIELKPFERLIINGAAIRNGDRRARFIVETHCSFLRESEILHERDADTPCKRLVHMLQVVYLAPDREEPIALYRRMSAEIALAMPGSWDALAGIAADVEAGSYHRAIKKARELVAAEAALPRAA